MKPELANYLLYMSAQTHANTFHFIYSCLWPNS